MPYDYEYPPQEVHRAHVQLFNELDTELFNGHLDVHVGEPLGSWVEFKGIRIALRRVQHREYQGIVPPEEVENIVA